MLRIKGVPKVLEMIGQRIKKRARFVGTHEGLDRVMKERANTYKCQQWPRKKQYSGQVPLEIRVDYLVTEDEFVYIIQVYATIRGSI